MSMTKLSGKHSRTISIVSMNLSSRVIIQIVHSPHARTKTFVTFYKIGPVSDGSSFLCLGVRSKALWVLLATPFSKLWRTQIFEFSLGQKSMLLRRSSSEKPKTTSKTIND